MRKNSIYPPSTIAPTSYTCHATIPPKTSRSQVLIILHRQAKVSNGLFVGGKVMEYSQFSKAIYLIDIWKTKHWNTQKINGLQKIWGFHVQRKSIFRSSTLALSVFLEKKTSLLKAFFCFWLLHGGFLKWWVSPTTMGFPTKNDQHLGCEMGGNPPFTETPTSPRNHSLWSQCVLLLHHRVDDRSMFEASNRVHRSIFHPWKSNWGYPIFKRLVVTSFTIFWYQGFIIIKYCWWLKSQTTTWDGAKTL